MVRLRPQLWPTLITLPALVLTLGLGYWQLERRDWKHGIIDLMETRLAAAPVALPGEAAWEALDPAAWDFRPVFVLGSFHHDKEMHRFTHLPSTDSSGVIAGYGVITPLEMPGGGFVLVDRGFVPEAAKDPSSRPDRIIDGPVRIEGVARAPTTRGTFVPEDAVDENIWYHRDLGAMAAHTGLGPVAPLFVAVTAAPTDVDGLRGSDRMPRPHAAKLDLPDNHLSYAITWFGLALGIAVIYLVYHRGQNRLTW